MTKINIKEIVENLLDTFLYASKVSLDLRVQGLTKEVKSDKYMFNPSGMVVYLMKAIQELESKVAALEAA